MHKTIVAISLMLACSHQPTTQFKTSGIEQPPCVVTAIPDDGLDDRLGVQAAITARCCLPAGTFDIDMPPTPPVGRRDYNVLTMRHRDQLCGAGRDKTFLKFHGDANRQDVRGVGIIGNDVSIFDVSLDTSLWTGTVEQAHAIHVLGPWGSGKSSIHDTNINHPERGMLGGDAIDLVGYLPSSVVDNLRIYNNHMTCDRSCVEAHSGTANIEIVDNDMTTGDIAIDTEGSGGHSKWTIARNTIHGSEHQQGPYGIAMDLMRGASIFDNVLDGVGIYLYSCDHCSIVNNVITMSSGTGPGAVVEAVKVSSYLLIAGNTMTRAAGMTPGPMIHVGPHEGAPESVHIMMNTMAQNTNASILAAEGIVGLTFAFNVATYAGTAANIGAVVVLGSAGAAGIRTTGVSLLHNKLYGMFGYAFGISGSYAGTGNMTIVGNEAPSVARGLVCEGVALAGKILGPVVYTKNVMPAPTVTCAPVLNAGL